MARRFSIDYEKITQKIKETEEKKGYEKDHRIYLPKVNDKGVGTVIMRFLPNKILNDVPYVQIFSHSFKVGSSFYIGNCPTSIGQPCPACEDNTQNWDLDMGTEREKSRRERSRKLNVYSNVLIIDDKQNPENNGKVFLFKFGKTIFGKYKAKIHPSKEDLENGEEKVNVYDPYDGVDFKLKIKTKKTGDQSFLNYDESTFSETPTPIADNDDEIEKILNSCYDIKEFIDEKNFKPYSELKERLDLVLNKTSKKPTPAKASIEESDDEDFDDSEDEEDEDETPISREKFMENLKKSMNK